MLRRGVVARDGDVKSPVIDVTAMRRLPVAAAGRAADTDHFLFITIHHSIKPHDSYTIVAMMDFLGMRRMCCADEPHMCRNPYTQISDYIVVVVTVNGRS